MSNITRYKIESDEKWGEWCGKIPAIQFDAGWSIKVIPPFAGAMARFLVEANGKSASVYLDCHNALGFMDGAYWEVYPVDDDTARCMIGDVGELLELIRRSLKLREEE